MKDSVTYQEIVNEGKVQGRHDFLLQVCRKKFGPPDEPTMRKLRSIEDVDRLAQLAERIFDVTSWDELLAE